ncbi:MAG: M48 family metalloprotease, partial [Armatimonadota bacterium]
MMAAAILLACTLPAFGDLEDAIGRVMAEAFIAQRGRMSQPVIDEWLNAVGDDLLEHCPRHDLHYRFIVLDSPEANGFALPGGWIFVTAGLLETLQSEDELAAVLGHELAHLVDRDFQRHVKRAALFYGIAELLRGNHRGDWVPLLQGVQLVNTLRHSRRQEAQADHVGATIAWRAGYDAGAMDSFLGGEPAWSYLETVFATHPHPAKRAERIHRHLAELRADDPRGAIAIAR